MNIDTISRRRMTRAPVAFVLLLTVVFTVLLEGADAEGRHATPSAVQIRTLGGMLLEKRNRRKRHEEQDQLEPVGTAMAVGSYLTQDFAPVVGADDETPVIIDASQPSRVNIEEIQQKIDEQAVQVLELDEDEQVRQQIMIIFMFISNLCLLCCLATFVTCQLRKYGLETEEDSWIRHIPCLNLCLSDEGKYDDVEYTDDYYVVRKPREITRESTRRERSTSPPSPAPQALRRSREEPPELGGRGGSVGGDTFQAAAAAAATTQIPSLPPGDRRGSRESLPQQSQG